MCLKIKKRIIIEFVERDQIVYKILQKENNCYYSPHYSMFWSIDKENKEPISKILKNIGYLSDSTFRVGVGLHAFIQKKAAETYLLDIPNYAKADLVIARMVIPAGSLIIMGKDYEIVATEMKLIKIL